MVLGFEGWAQGRHLVDDAAKRPDVALFIVLLIVDLLWAHVVRCANVGLGKHGLLIHNSGEAEITQFSVSLTIEENVAGFEITVEDLLDAILWLRWFSFTSVDWRRFLSSMAEGEGTGDLCQNLPYEFLAYEVIGLDAPFDYLLQVPALTVFHDDVDFEIALIDAPVVVAYDVRVVQISQYVDFRDDLLLFFLVHLSIVKLLPDEDPTITYTPNFTDIAKAT